MAVLEAYGKDILGGYGTANGNLADEYDSSKTYNEGDHCIHNGVYLTCNTDSTTGTFDSTKWDSETVGEEIKQINTDLSAFSNRFKYAEIKGMSADSNGNITLPNTWNNVNILSAFTNASGFVSIAHIGHNGTLPFIHFTAFDGVTPLTGAIDFVVFYFVNAN